jgi:hypothetical protein
MISNLAGNFKFKNLKLIFRGGCIATTVLEKTFSNIFRDGCIAATAPSNTFSEAVYLLQLPLK